VRHHAEKTRHFGRKAGTNDMNEAVSDSKYLQLNIDRRSITQRRNTDMRPAESTEIESDILRVLELRPVDFLVGAGVQFGRLGHRDDKRRAENTSRTGLRGKPLFFGCFGFDRDCPAERLDPVCHLHVRRVGIAD